MQDSRTPSGIAAASFSVIVVLTMIVVVQNTETVHATVLFSTIAMPLTLLLILTLASGMLSGAVLYRTLAHSRRRR